MADRNRCGTSVLSRHHGFRKGKQIASSVAVTSGRSLHKIAGLVFQKFVVKPRVVRGTWFRAGDVRSRAVVGREFPSAFSGSRTVISLCWQRI